MKRIILTIFGLLAALVLMIVIFWISFVYTSEYKVTERDTAVSPDGKYELLLQAVGEAAFPFGPAKGRLVLIEEGNTVVEDDFTLYDDGRAIGSDSWKVTWYDDYVEIILSGKEQFDEQVILYYDGRKEWTQLTGIKSQESKEKERLEEIEEIEAGIEESKESVAEEKKEPEESKNSSQLYAKYSEVLMQILTDRTDPDGRYFDDGGQGVDFSRNCFAITDVDGDGRDELIFNFNDTYMAAMREIVYDYDEENDTLRTELGDVFPFTRYYSNGYVKEDASHNHTCDPETRGIWPYNLYKYDADTDSYINIGYVQCWDKLVFPTNYEDEAFPDEFDADGDNLLFFVGYYSNESDDVECTYMDREEFETWEQTMFPDEYRLGIEYHHMTEEEIEEIHSGFL